MAREQDFLGLVVRTIETTIQSGQTTSSVIALKGVTLKTIIVPSSFDGTQLTFQISDDGTNFYDYYNIDDLEVALTCSPGRAYGTFANDFFSVSFLKITSNATESATRTIKLITRGI